VILKIVPKAGFDVYTGKINQWQRSKGGNRPVAEKKTWKKILQRLLEQYLELVDALKEAS